VRSKRARSVRAPAFLNTRWARCKNPACERPAKLKVRAEHGHRLRDQRCIHCGGRYEAFAAWQRRMLETVRKANAEAAARRDARSAPEGGGVVPLSDVLGSALQPGDPTPVSDARAGELALRRARLLRERAEIDLALAKLEQGK
jgi:hypothetical protein